MELKEVIAPSREGMLSDWRATGASPEVIRTEAAQAEAFIKRLRTVLRAKFDSHQAPEYETDSSERERAVAAGYRKCLKDVYRLLYIDI